MCSLFSIGNRLQKQGTTHWSCFSVPDDSIYCYWDPATSFVVLRWNLQWGSATSHPVHQVWRSPFSVTSEIVLQVHPIHQVSRSPITDSTVSNRVMYSNLHCESYQCNDWWSPLYVATVAPFCSESPFISYHSVIVLPDLWSCNYATNLHLSCQCDYAC